MYLMSNFKHFPSVHLRVQLLSSIRIKLFGDTGCDTFFFSSILQWRPSISVLGLYVGGWGGGVGVGGEVIQDHLSLVV